MKATDGSFLKKPWRVVTTLRGLAEKLDQKKCDNLHWHGKVEGKETARSGSYPQAMADFVSAA
eukprot:759288-Prorocentrum_lima.AAC.1